jgi:hypothetical protein
MCTLKVGNGDGVSSLGFLKADWPFAFLLLLVMMIELDSPTPSMAVYT